MDGSDEVFICDLLILGGGGAGCMAAIEATRWGADVIIISKEPVGFGDTKISGGSMAGVVNPEDSVKQYFEDTLEAGEKINDPELALTLAEEGRNAIHRLERYGCFFQRGISDQWVTWKLGGHRENRTLTCGKASATMVTQTLKGEVARYGIKVMDEMFVTGLLLTDGQIAGATLIDVKQGHFFVIRAKSVIIASGGIGELFSPHTSNVKHGTGDGLAYAFQAGAELMDMEMIQFAPYALTHPKGMSGKYLGEPSLAGPYGKLLNAKGERFMVRVDPDLKEFSTRAKVSCAMAIEVSEGRGTEHGGCFLDLTENRKHPEGREFYEAQKARQRWLYELVWSAYGEKAAELEEPWEVYPTQHYMMGGIRVNSWGESSVPGLYAVGQAQGGTHGANRLGSNSLTELFVFGYRAGIRAAQRVTKMKLPAVDWDRVDDERYRVYNLLAFKKTNISPTFLKKRLQHLCWENLGVLREEKRLEFLLDEIQDIQRQTTHMGCSSSVRRYNLEWIDALELPNMLTVAKISTQAALLRKESRGAHYRLDYPQRDDTHWRKNIIARWRSGNIEFHPVEPMASSG